MKLIFLFFAMALCVNVPLAQVNPLRSQPEGVRAISDEIPFPPSFHPLHGQPKRRDDLHSLLGDDTPATGSTIPLSWQWVSPLPQGNWLHDVHLFDGENAVAVGDGGTVIKTNDAGQHWTVKTRVAGTKEDLTSVLFFDDTTGIAVGRFAFLRTSDGGETWTNHLMVDSVGNRLGLGTLRFPTRSHGYASGFGGLGLGIIIRTSNEGETWDQFTAEPGVSMRTMSFANKDTGIVLASYFTSVPLQGPWAVWFRTTNAGLTWTEFRDTLDYTLYDVQFISKDTVLFAYEAKLLRSTDAGLTWSQMYTEPDANMRWGGFIQRSDSIIDVYGKHNFKFGAVLRSTNRGTSWSKITNLYANRHAGYSDVNVVKLSADGSGFSVGYGGSIYRVTNNASTWTYLSTGTGLSLTKLAFPVPDTGYAISYDGGIIRSTNRGRNWMTLSSLPLGFAYGNGISFVDGSTGWVIGNAVIHTSDAGGTWVNRSPITGMALVDLSFCDDHNGLAVGEDGTIFRTTDGGITWVDRSDTTSMFLTTVFMIDSLNCLVGGSQGPNTLILRSTDGGVVWSPQSYSAHISGDFSFADSLHGWLPGLGSTTDGGTTWTGPWTIQSHSVHFLDANIGLSVFGNGSDYFTTDGGDTWKLFPAPVSGGLVDVKFSRDESSTIAFAIGGAGNIVCAAFSPLPGKTWTGATDSFWNNPTNWSPEGVPSKSDSVIIPPTIHQPVILGAQQLVFAGALTILSAGRLSISDSLGEFVVKGDVNIYGTFELRPPTAATTIIAGGNWYDHNGTGFVPARSTVYIARNKSVRGIFHNVVFDTLSTMTMTGNIVVTSQCAMLGDINAGSSDTLIIESADPDALIGNGTMDEGSVRRSIDPAANTSYRFGSTNTTVQFDSSGGIPGFVTLTTFPSSLPDTLSTTWLLVPSSVDTVQNIVIADSVTEFSRWAIGTGRPTGPIPIIRRYFIIQQQSGTNFLAHLTLSYEQNEVPPGTSESSLQLLRAVEISVSISLERNWNLISIPVGVPNDSVSVLFPTSTTSAFAYSGGAYQTSNQLNEGVGYWLKFGSAWTSTITGTPIDSDTLSVDVGWNLVGSISQPVLVSTITSNPPGLLTSPFYGYGGDGYAVADTIQPGKAYWVKVAQGGALFLSSSSAAHPLEQRIKIVQTNDMPPKPPTDEESGNSRGLPTEFALQQNYPNPFNPVTVINYQLPIDNYVSLKVYNLLGQEIATLVNENQKAGYRSVQWNAANIPTGVYFYRIHAGTFSEAKKLLLLK